MKIERGKMQLCCRGARKIALLRAAHFAETNPAAGDRAIKSARASSSDPRRRPAFSRNSSKYRSKTTKLLFCGVYADNR